MSYKIEIRPRALRSLAKIPEPDRGRIIKRIDRLGDDPRPEGSKKLKGADDLYRIRVGDYRVVYGIRDAILTVLVVRVAHRRDVYGK